MKRQCTQAFLSRAFLVFTLAFCALLFSMAVFLSVWHGGNDLYSFSEPVLALGEGWTLTDSAGNARAVDLPETIPYGTDGCYTLSRTLPKVDGLLISPAFEFYSNYVDVRVSLDGKELYAYPPAMAAFSGATGNTYHFIRLPADYAGKTISVSVRGQLGNDITYLLKAPLLGSKATMLNLDVMRSLPSLTLASCMCILAIGLGVLYFAFRKQLNLNHATLYTALFSLLFAIYVSFETSFAQLLMPNGYLLCYATLMLLALVPLPLIGLFLDSVSVKFKPVLYGLMALCALNLLVQTVLNFAGVMSVRAMLPATHAVILLTIVVASYCLLFSSRLEKPRARRSLFSAVPMIVGGIVDIVLINLNRPSANNCFWFATGVAIFIVHQLYGFLRSYFALYRTSLQSKLLTDMAYYDVLSGIGNRNAYERKLKELSHGKPSRNLCCIVTDINDLKLINDTLGHQAGDTAIAEIGSVLREYMPDCAAFFRTGGDEFVVLLEEYDEARTQILSHRLSEEVKRRGELHAIPMSLAVGFGQYEDDDGNLLDFIRRVDTRMYTCKRKQKGESCRD